MITAKMETIDPKRANEYLKMNVRNYRPIVDSLVERYADDMKIGKWEENGESIKFYENGDLFDGQHRLNAIIRSNVKLQLMVERGIPNHVTIADWGGGRTLKQWGRANDLVISNMTQGIARAVIAGMSRGGVAKGKTTKYIEEHYDELKEAERLCTSGRRDSYGRRAPIGLAVYVIRKLGLIQDYIIENFFKIFNTGTTIEKDQRDPSAPLIASREIITKYRIGSGAEAQRGQYQIIIQALLDYKMNKNRKREYGIKEEPEKWLDEVRKMEGCL